MPQLPLPLDELTAAVTPYLDDALDVGDPATTLAELIDLAGGVALAEGLSNVDVGSLGEGDVAKARALFLDSSTHTIKQLEVAFETVWKPRFRLPTAARAKQIIDDAEAWGGERKPAKLAARNLWSPFGDYLETQLKRARFALRDLRVELAPLLSDLSPDAARLVALDTALEAGTKQAVEALYRRVPSAWAAVFGRKLRAALVDEVPVETWFAEGGWGRDVVADGQRLVRALVERERRRLAALVEAACALSVR